MGQLLKEITRDYRAKIKAGGAVALTEHAADFNEAARRDRSARLTLDDLGSVRDLFCESVCRISDGQPVGKELLMRSDNSASFARLVRQAESSGEVTTAAFPTLLGQMGVGTLLEELERAEHWAHRLHATEQAEMIGPEPVFGVSRIGSVAGLKVGEAKPYPHVGFGENYVTCPAKDKYGFIVPLTEELVWSDKTGKVREIAQSGVTEMVEELEILAVKNLTGLSTTYSRNKSALQATYADSHTGGDFDNLVASNPLDNYTAIETAIIAFSQMTDPDTGRPVRVPAALDLIVPTGLSMTANNIKNGTQVEIGTQSDALRTIVTNPLTGQNHSIRNIYTSPYISSLTGSSTTWYIGDFSRAFKWREVWPIESVTRGSDTEDGFNRDIAMQTKVRTFGVHYARQPMYVIKNTAS